MQDAEFMEQKKSERAGRGADAWQARGRQQELDEADRFQVTHAVYVKIAQAGRPTNRQIYACTHTALNADTNADRKLKDKQTKRQTSRQIHPQTGRRPDRQTCGRTYTALSAGTHSTDRQTDTLMLSVQ